MIRSYREIGKPASVLMFTGAGLSQGSSAEIVEESFLQNTLKIIVNGKEYLSTLDRASSFFVSSIVRDLDRAGYTFATTGNFPSASVERVVKFSLLENEYHEGLTHAFDSIIDIPFTNFKIISADLLNTKLKVTGTIQKQGTIKSAALNGATQLPVSTSLIPNSKVARRTILLPVSGLGSITNQKWVYNPYQKCLLSINQLGTQPNGYSNYIYKIDYDMETGILGNTVQDLGYSGVGTSGTYGIVTDRKNFRIVQQGIYSFELFDYHTLTKTMIYPERPLPMSTRIGWNFDEECIECYTSGSVSYFDYEKQQSVTDYIQGFKMWLDGRTEINTGWSSSIPNQPISSNSSLILSDSCQFYGKKENNRGLIMNGFFTLDRRHLIEDEYGIITTVVFNTTSSPTSMTLTSFMLPDTADALIRLPDIPVNVGDTFEIEYNIKMLDKR